MVLPIESVRENLKMVSLIKNFDTGEYDKNVGWYKNGKLLANCRWYYGYCVGRGAIN